MSMRYGPPDTDESAWELITTERRRQIEELGHTPEKDDLHDDNELSLAATCYRDYDEVGAYPTTAKRAQEWKDRWPWDQDEWRPEPFRWQNLVKAGALYLASSDRKTRDGDPMPAEVLLRLAHQCAGMIEMLREMQS